MAAASRRGMKISFDDAKLVVSYMGLEDQHLMADYHLDSLVLRHYTGGGKFNDVQTDLLGVVQAAVKVCEDLLDYTLTDNTFPDQVNAILEFRADQKKLWRLITIIELATEP